MRFKDFEIRQYKSLNGQTDPNKLELVKWYKTDEPIEVTDGITGEKKIHDTFCYVVAFIDWNNRESCWEFRSVGLRFLDDYQEGLCEFVRKYLEVLDVVRENTI